MCFGLARTFVLAVSAHKHSSQQQHAKQQYRFANGDYLFAEFAENDYRNVYWYVATEVIVSGKMIGLCKYRRLFLSMSWVPRTRQSQGRSMLKTLEFHEPYNILFAGGDSEMFFVAGAVSNSFRICQREYFGLGIGLSFTAWFLVWTCFCDRKDYFGLGIGL